MEYAFAHDFFCYYSLLCLAIFYLRISQRAAPQPTLAGWLAGRCAGSMMHRSFFLRLLSLFVPRKNAFRISWDLNPMSFFVSSVLHLAAFSLRCWDILRPCFVSLCGWLFAFFSRRSQFLCNNKKGFQLAPRPLLAHYWKCSANMRKNRYTFRSAKLWFFILILKFSLDISRKAWANLFLIFSARPLLLARV